ncbi:MAG: response regulator transcription factor [Anaerolineaceae bacterium]|nr:response regulator transcription factor [Anaerolineaceae bacterium]
MAAAKKRIILIEGKQAEHPSFFFSLQSKGYDVDLARNGVNAIAKMNEHPADIAVLDAASLHTSGKQIISSLKKKFPKLHVILIVDDSYDKSKMSPDADIVLSHPFTLHKLMNRINVILADSERESIVDAGSIKFDPELQIVFAHGNSFALTPRVSALLEMLIDNQGEIVPREDLYREVWKTDNVDDMRTLDVHIRWLGEAIEEDPKRPKLLQTSRGKGYRLLMPNQPIGK